MELIDHRIHDEQFAATWMDLESVSQSDNEGEILYDIPYMWTLKRNDTNERTYKTERDSDLKNELMVARGKDCGKG